MDNAQNQANGGAASALGNFQVEDAARMMEQGREAVDTALQAAEDFVRERPLLSLAGALAIGYVIGKIVSR